MWNFKINNLPNYAEDYKYIVVTLVDGELWFYGAYDEYDKAKRVSEETSERLVIENTFMMNKTKKGFWSISEYEYLDCSVCGHSVYTGCSCTSEAKQQLEYGDYPNYCPHCGARMVGVSE